jgi:hypothetical protein
MEGSGVLRIAIRRLKPTVKDSVLLKAGYFFDKTDGKG